MAVAETVVDRAFTAVTATRVAAETVVADMVEIAVAVVDTVETVEGLVMVETAVALATVEVLAMAEVLVPAQTTVVETVVDSKVGLIAVPDLEIIAVETSLDPISLHHHATVALKDLLVATKVQMLADRVEMATATTPVGVEQAVAQRKQVSTKIGKIKKAVSRRYNPLSLLPSGPGEVNGELAVPPVQM